MRITGTSPKVKECNCNLVRWTILERGCATKPEVAEATGISLMTVGKIINSMVEDGTILSGGMQGAAFGRKAEKYFINPAAGMGLSLRFRMEGVDLVLSDNIGHMICEKTFPMELGYQIRDLKPVKRLLLKFSAPLKAVVAGFPAAVFEGKLHSGHLHQFFDIDLEKELSEFFKLPVLIGRDMNICAIGYSRLGLEPFSGQSAKISDLVYILLDESGYGAGCLSGGRIVRGFRHFSGEIGRMELANGQFFRDFMDAKVSDSEYVKVVAQFLGAITCILNPSVVIFSGSSVRPELLEAIQNHLQERISFRWEGQVSTVPALLFEENLWPSYRNGMIYAVTRRIHSGVCMVESD